jgi:hypothetical protein
MLLAFRRRTRLVVALMFIAAVGSSVASATRRGLDVEPETVMITFRAKAGAEKDLARVIADHWAVAKRLDLVHDAPHVTLRMPDANGTATFVDIFTWRDAAIPDSAPQEIRAIWDAMNKLVESRGGRPGLEIVMVDLLSRP